MSLPGSATAARTLRTMMSSIATVSSVTMATRAMPLAVVTRWVKSGSRTWTPALAASSNVRATTEAPVSTMASTARPLTLMRLKKWPLVPALSWTVRCAEMRGVSFSSSPSDASAGLSSGEPAAGASRGAKSSASKVMPRASRMRSKFSAAMAPTPASATQSVASLSALVAAYDRGMQPRFPPDHTTRVPAHCHRALAPQRQELPGKLI